MNRHSKATAEMPLKILLKVALLSMVLRKLVCLTTFVCFSPFGVWNSIVNDWTETCVPKGFGPNSNANTTVTNVTDVCGVYYVTLKNEFSEKKHSMTHVTDMTLVTHITNATM